MGENTLGKRIEQSRVSLSIAAKMLEKMRANQKRYYENRRSTHTFKVGDLVLLRKHNVDKLELKGSQITGLLNSPQPGQLLLRTNLAGKVKDATLVTSNPNTPLRIGN